MDSVTSDLGYITNSGISRKQKNHVPATDDMFRVEVGIQMADMDETDGSVNHKIYFAVKFGEIIVVGRFILKPRICIIEPVFISQ